MVRKITLTLTLSVSLLKLYYGIYLALTFVQACRHIASRRAQQNPKDHSTRHESSSVGW